MTIDASAFLSSLLDEPDADVFNRAVADELEDLPVSPVNFVEAAIRADKGGAQVSSEPDEIMRVGGIGIASLSKARGEPLLFKVEDFRRTDVEAVI